MQPFRKPRIETRFHTEKFRYLIKHQGVWKILSTYASDPDWDKDVTDVISLKSAGRIGNLWRKKNGRRYIMRLPVRVQDHELTLLLLQVEEM